MHKLIQVQCRHGCSWSCWKRSSRNRHKKSCKLNPIPKAPYTVSTGTATSLTLQVINNTDAKLTFQLIFCFAKLQSEVDGGNTISYKICFVPLGEQSNEKNWFFFNIVRTSETPPPLSIWTPKIFLLRKILKKKQFFSFDCSPKRPC